MKLTFYFLVTGQAIYDNFMALHVAITILSCPIYVKIAENIEYAQQLLEYFIRTFEITYGKKYMSYNFHNLLHICLDVKKFGHLDAYSAFKFENYMSAVKKNLEKTTNLCNS